MPVTKKVFIVNVPTLTRLSRIVPTLDDKAVVSGGDGFFSGAVMGPMEYIMASAKVFLQGVLESDCLDNQ